MNEEIDEDMIRGYKCRKCGFGVWTKLLQGEKI